MEGPLTPQLRREILDAGILAPTAHNAQPWRFRWDGDVIELRRDDAHCFEHLDFENGAAHVGLGAAVENMVLKAGSLGMGTDVTLFPELGEPALVARIALAPEPDVPVEPALVEAIARRCANRRLGRRVSLNAHGPGGELAALEGVASDAGGRLLVIEAPRDLDRLGRLAGRSDRLGFSNPGVHREVFDGFRWTPEEARANQRGLSVETLELGRADRVALRLLSRPGVPRFLERLHLAGALEMMGRKVLKSAAAAALLVCPGVSPTSYANGGRALERVWLTATNLGLGLYPLANLPYFFARLERGAGRGLSPAAARALPDIRRQYRALFPVPADHAEILLFTLARVPPPSARAARIPLDAVLDG